MEEQEALRHLLDVESQALTMADDAQAEADRRIAESEKRGRALFDEKYGEKAAGFDETYTKELALIKEEYKKELLEYGTNLDRMKPDQEQFDRLLEKLLNEA